MSHSSLNTPNKAADFHTQFHASLGGFGGPSTTVNSNLLKPRFLMHHCPKAWLATVVLGVGQNREMPVSGQRPHTLHGGRLLSG